MRQFIDELFKSVENDIGKEGFADSLESMLKDKMRDLKTEEIIDPPKREKLKYEEIDNREAVLAAKHRETGLKKILDEILGGRDLGEFYRHLGENLFANDAIKSYL